MRRRRGQAGLLQGIAHLLRRPLEVPGELDFLVANRPHLRERALEVLLHVVADGVELHPETVDLRGVQAGTRDGGCAHGDDKGAAIDHGCFPSGSEGVVSRSAVAGEVMSEGWPAEPKLAPQVGPPPRRFAALWRDSL